MDEKQNVIDAIREAIDRDDHDAIRAIAEATHPSDFAEAMEELNAEERWGVLTHLDDESASVILSHFDQSVQAETVEGHEPETVAAWVSKMSADDRADIVKALDEPFADEVLSELPIGQRSETEGLARYEEGTAGALMSTEFAAIPQDATVAEALDLIRLEAPNKETIYSIFVLDGDNRLAGDISLKDLILAAPGDKIAELMDPDTPRVQADDNWVLAADMVKDYDLLALPVVSDDEKLLGIVTVDDVLDVNEDEATDDFHRMGVVGQLGTDVKHIGLAALYRARIPWLLVLVFINVFSGAGIAYFEDTIEAVVALVFFLPLLIDSGGNAGSQAATLMVRAMAVGDVRMNDWFRLFRREIAISLAIGCSMALAVMLIASFRAPEVLVPVGLTMVCTVMLGSLVGMSLPFLLGKLNLDPATASAPLVTSIADIGGVLIYFAIATWWLRDAIEAAAQAAG